MSATQFLINKLKTCGNVDQLHAYAETLEYVLALQNKVTLKLIAPGSGGKIPIIKELRAKFNLSLQESKQLTEQNFYGLPPMSHEDALQFQSVLKSIGAEVEIITAIGA